MGSLLRQTVTPAIRLRCSSTFIVNDTLDAPSIRTMPTLQSNRPVFPRVNRTPAAIVFASGISTRSALKVYLIVNAFPSQSLSGRIDTTAIFDDECESLYCVDKECKRGLFDNPEAENQTNEGRQTRQKITHTLQATFANVCLL